MKTLRFFATWGLCAFAVSGASGQTKPDPSLPHLQKKGAATQLIVDGQPYLALAGELRNSTTSSQAYMKPIWPRLAAARLNTVLAAVTWELMEPEEGRFDFTVVDNILKDARENDQRVVLLWFGSWKNGKSTYQPLWMKTNQVRFPLIQNEQGMSLPTLTTLSDNNRGADARAYAALMRHLRQVDGSKHTVLMMQVENETGVLDTPRDYSPAANRAFNGPVPRELMDYLQARKEQLIPQLHQAWQAAGFKTSGTWEEVFGKSTVNKNDWRAWSYFTEEIFMAWHYARYVGSVAAAGKKEYDIPMYMNTWIKQDISGWPGAYPSGGPQPTVLDIWHAGAPAIDLYSPDCHLTNFTDWCRWYTQAGNPLFIPESAGDAVGAAHALWLFGKYDGIGFSPFGIDGNSGTNTPLARVYQLVSTMAPLILAHQGDGSMTAIVLDNAATSETVRLGDYNIEARSMTRNAGPVTNPPVALLIRTGPDDYVIAARGLNLYFTAATEPLDHVALAAVEEGVYENGRWIPGRRLNGDETPEWKAMRFNADYTIQHVTLFRYP
jgi:beta-galactosidase GanA